MRHPGTSGIGGLRFADPPYGDGAGCQPEVAALSDRSMAVRRARKSFDKIDLATSISLV
jgi:hypothetical protein